jgi:hypothetical protein
LSIEKYLFALFCAIIISNLNATEYAIYYTLDDSLKIGITGSPFMAFSSDKGTSAGAKILFFEKNTHISQKSGNDFKLKLDAEMSNKKEISTSIDMQIPILKKNDIIRTYMLYKENENDFYGFGGNTANIILTKYNKKQYRLNLDYLHSLKNDIKLGIATDISGYKNTENEQINQIIRGLNSFYRAVGLGAMILFQDKKPNNFPTQGSLFCSKFLIYNKDVFSNYNFQTLQSEYQHFFPIENHILAFQAVSNNTFGNLPLNYYPTQGNAYLMRGVATDRYMNEQYLATQIEYRSPILFWRLSGVTFCSSAISYSGINDFKTENIHLSEGLGLRIALDKTERVNLRADIGFYKNEQQIYLKFSEAF